MEKLRGKLTYANVVSTLSLFMLLGGGAAFAASHLAKNSDSAQAALSGAVGPTGPKGASAFYKGKSLQPR